MKTVTYKNYTITQAPSHGTVKIIDAGKEISIVKPVLRDIATELGVGKSHSTGTEKNTRHLGFHVIKAIEGLR